MEKEGGRGGKRNVLLPSLTFLSSGGRLGSGDEVNQSSGRLPLRSGLGPWSLVKPLVLGRRAPVAGATRCDGWTDVLERCRVRFGAATDGNCSGGWDCCLSVAALPVHGREAEEPTVQARFHGGGGQRRILILVGMDI